MKTLFFAALGSLPTCALQRPLLPFAWGVVRLCGKRRLLSAPLARMPTAKFVGLPVYLVRPTASLCIPDSHRLRGSVETEFGADSHGSRVLFRLVWLKLCESPIIGVHGSHAPKIESPPHRTRKGCSPLALGFLNQLLGTTLQARPNPA